MIEKLLNKLGYMKKPKFNRCHKVRIKNLQGIFTILEVKVFFDYSTIKYCHKLMYKVYSEKYGILHIGEKDLEKIK